jgi:hypothetical protein
MSYGKLRNREVFEATVNGKHYTFTCYTQSCGTHVRELCCEGFSNTTESKWIKRDIVGKDIWLNRPWYRWRYENALRKGIENVAPDKETEQALKDILIERKAQADHERCEKEIQAFQSLYEKTSPQFKERMANSDIIMQNDSDVQAVKGLMLLDMLMNN